MKRIVLLGCVAVLGCGAPEQAATGNVEVFLEPEDNIAIGMTGGTGAGEISDGWSITYEAFVVAFGGVEAGRSEDSGATLRDDTVHLVDFKNTPASGLTVFRFDNILATRWDRFSYTMPVATASARVAPGVAASDAQRMVDQGLSARIVGTARKTGGQSCPNGNAAACVPRDEVHFTFELRTPQRYADCAPEEGDSGFAVPAGGTALLKPTFHGDHWFLSSHATHNNALYAQWIADCDLNGDGNVDVEELRNVPAQNVFPSPRYNLSGFPGAITTAADYLEVGLRTMGHFQGEGECPTRTAL